MVRIRIRVRMRFSVWLVSCYAHAFVRLWVVTVTLPLFLATISAYESFFIFRQLGP